MAELSDETLMAYADDVLEKAERAQVKAILEQHPELMERVRQFERTGRIVGQAFDDVLNEPVPAALLEQVRRAPIGTASVPAQVTDLAQARRVRADAVGRPASAGILRSWQAMALAASVCAVIGTGAGWTAHSVVDSRQARAPTDTLVQIALEVVPGNREAALPINAEGAVKMKPVVTFLDKDNRFCRQYQFSGTNAAIEVGVACRTDGGGWKVLAQAPITAIKTAGAATETPGAVLARIMSGDYLSADREAQLIGRKWKP